MAKCSTWHVDNIFINAFRLKFRLSNSTSPKTACSSKLPKTKKFENFLAPAQTKVSLALSPQKPERAAWAGSFYKTDEALTG